jgi:uncharacterized membrane protein
MNVLGQADDVAIPMSVFVAMIAVSFPAVIALVAWIIRENIRLSTILERVLTVLEGLVKRVERLEDFHDDEADQKIRDRIEKERFTT